MQQLLQLPVAVEDALKGGSISSSIPQCSILQTLLHLAAVCTLNPAINHTKSDTKPLLQLHPPAITSFCGAFAVRATISLT
jgi:hypothetical protein